MLIKSKQNFRLVLIETRRQNKYDLKFIHVLGKADINVEKGENIDSRDHFRLFPQCFQKASYTESLKVIIVWYTINTLPSLPSPLN